MKIELNEEEVALLVALLQRANFNAAEGKIIAGKLQQRLEEELRKVQGRQN